MNFKAAMDALDAAARDMERERCAKVAEQEATQEQAEQLENSFGAILTPLMAYNLGRKSAAGDIRRLTSTDGSPK